jgi:hypothetical protein
MDILYRHFFGKWDLIGKVRYPDKSRKRLAGAALFLEEGAGPDKENEGIGNEEEEEPSVLRKRRLVRSEATKTFFNMMASFTKE